MEYSEKLANLLYDYQHRNSNLTGWRFDLSESRGLEVGLKNNRIGGPYTAPSYKRSISGELYLIWKDQKFTSTKLDANVIEDFNEYVNLWQTTAYYDPDGVGLYKPEHIPQVDLIDPQVQKIIGDNDQAPFRLLEQGLEQLTTESITKIDGKIRCYEGRRHLINSEGLTVEYSLTPVDFFFEANDSYGESYRERKWPDQKEVRRIISNTARIGKQLTQEIPQKLSGKIRLLFPSGIFESFIDQFLINNLYGSLVVNRQSRFSLADFQNQSQILRNDLSLEVNTLLPHRYFSYPCTSEAIPGGLVSYIQNGKLQTPILSLKYAKKSGMKPTPVPSGFFLKTANSLPTWEQLLKQTEYGMIVYSVLGLHTQDASSGLFSLNADQCLLVEKGEIVGKVKGVINGDFLGSLLLEESSFGTMEGEDNPGYSFWATVAG